MSTAYALDFPNRHLDSETGRFIQSDPHAGELVNPKTYNSKYLYVVNNPILNIDPNGMDVVMDPMVVLNVMKFYAFAFNFKINSANALLFQKGDYVGNMLKNISDNGASSFAVSDYFSTPVKAVIVVAYSIVNLKTLEQRVGKIFNFFKNLF
jgi:RHS repeat-associated protein